MAEKHFKELLKRLSLKDKFLLRVAKYMPSVIRKRIQMGYILLFVSWAIESGFRQLKEEMGNEAFQKMLDQLPTSIKDKDGVWTLPAGTTEEEVSQFLMQLREQSVDILDKSRF